MKKRLVVPLVGLAISFALPIFAWQKNIVAANDARYSVTFVTPAARGAVCGPTTFESYAKPFRQLVAEIAGIRGGKKRFESSLGAERRRDIARVL